MILILSAFTSDSLAATRISFARGRSAAAMSGTIPAGGTREYVLGARRNQMMTIEVTSGNNNIVIDLDDVNGHLQYGDGYSQVTTNASGDHWITLKNEGGRATRFTMTVSIR